MKITRITVQKRNNERFNIFVNRGDGEEYGFSVDTDVFIKFQLKKGMELKEEEIPAIVYADQIKKAFNLSLNFLSYRMRSNLEIAQYLEKKGFEQEPILEVQSRLKKNGYVDDLEFAKAFVRSKSKMSTKGPGILKQELIVKGISQYNIEEALKEFPFEQQVEAAANFAEKQFKKSQKRSMVESNKKVAQNLQGKGFPYEVIQVALEQIQVPSDKNEEWEACVYQGNKAKRKFKKYDQWEYKNRIKQYLYRRGFSLDMIEQFLNEELNNDLEG